MSTFGRIRAAISCIGRNDIFSTRSFLGMGSRGAVDQALYMLVKSKIIIRIARGLFVKNGAQLPSIYEVAKLKAESFGKEICSHGSATSRGFGLTSNPESHPVFACTGRSSSFMFGSTRIFFVGMSPRKLHRKQDQVGDFIRAAWHIGKKAFSDSLIQRTYFKWSKLVPQLELAASLLPEWINEKFYWARPGSRKNSSGPLPPLFIDLSLLMPEYAHVFDQLPKLDE